MMGEGCYTLDACEAAINVALSELNNSYSPSRSFITNSFDDR